MTETKCNLIQCTKDNPCKTHECNNENCYCSKQRIGFEKGITGLGGFFT